MATKDYERVMNIFTCKNHEGKNISINLDNIDYWIEDSDPNMTEVHTKTLCALWIKVNEKTFRKNYIEYKTLNK